MLLASALMLSGAFAARAEAASACREHILSHYDDIREGHVNVEYTASPTGFRYKNGKTYYYVNNKMKTGWQTVNGKRYYFVKSGKNKGAMLTGKQKIGDFWYFLDPEMKTGVIRTDAGVLYYSGSDGHLKTGWRTIDGKKYYFWCKTQNGHIHHEAARGVKSVNGTYYLFDGNEGYLKYGLNEHGGKLFYTDKSGKLQKGFCTIDGERYYFNINTNRFEAHEGKLNYNGRHYICFSGKVQTGLISYGGELYYAGEDGCLKTGWQEADGKRYYFLPEKTADQPVRAAAKGELTIDDTACFFNEDGTLDMDRTVKLGLSEEDGTWHFYYPVSEGGHEKGEMAREPVFYKGNYYWFDSNGDAVTGWQMEDGDYAYFNEKGMYIQDRPAMKLTVIDYGKTNGSYGSNYGDATLMESKGEYLLLDTLMPNGSTNLIKKLKELGVKRLSIYISHYHDDHIGCVPAILKDSYFTVEKLYLPDASYMYGKNKNTKWFKAHTAIYEKSVELARKHGTQVITIREGDTIQCGLVKGSVLFQKITPDFTGNASDHGQVITYINNHSLVTMFACGRVRFLTAGDIESGAEKDLLAKGLDLSAEIFKLSHHGGSSGNTKKLLEAIGAGTGYYTNPNEVSGLLQDSWCRPVINRAQSLGMNLFHPLVNGTFTLSVSEGSVFVSGTRRMKTVSVPVVNKVTGAQESVNVTVQGAANGKYKIYENMIPFYCNLK